MPTDNDEEKKTTIEDFYIYEKVRAFCKKYEPATEQTFNSEVFNEERLREFFKAYTIPSHGDPLVLYMDDLNAQGYSMSVSISGEPAIIVNEKFN